VNDIPPLRTILEAIFHFGAVQNQRQSCLSLIAYNHRLPGHWEPEASALESGAGNLGEQLAAISQQSRPVAHRNSPPAAGQWLTGDVPGTLVSPSE